MNEKIIIVLLSVALAISIFATAIGGAAYIKEGPVITGAHVHPEPLVTETDLEDYATTMYVDKGDGLIIGELEIHEKAASKNMTAMNKKNMSQDQAITQVFGNPTQGDSTTMVSSGNFRLSMPDATYNTSTDRFEVTPGELIKLTGDLPTTDSAELNIIGPSDYERKINTNIDKDSTMTTFFAMNNEDPEGIYVLTVKQGNKSDKLTFELK